MPDPGLNRKYAKGWVRFLPAVLREKVAGRDYLQNVISNTGWQFADNILRMGVGLLVGIWVARYLGPEQFGLLSYALALAALFSTFAMLGLDDIVVRDLVRDPEGKDEILGTAFTLKLFGGSIAFLAALATILMLRPTDEVSHWLVGIIAAGSIFQVFNIIDFWFYSQVSAKYIVLARNAAFLICSACKIAFILTAAPLLAFAWVTLLEVVVGAAGLIIAYRAKGNRFGMWRFNLTRARSLLRDCWPLIFTGVAATIYLRIDQVMLGEMAGGEEVGIYSVAVRMAEVWFFIPTAVYWSVFPAIVEAKAESEELFYTRLQLFYNSMALVAYGIAIPVTFLGEWLVGVLYGDAYARGGVLLVFLIWTNVFTSLEMARSSFLMTMNWTRIYLVIVLMGAVLNVGLNYLLIPQFGGMGAVIASLVSYWFVTHGSCFLFRPLRKTGWMLTKALVYPKVW
jgi:O-antigen/teichoic acid export membrane protein